MNCIHCGNPLTAGVLAHPDCAAQYRRTTLMAGIARLNRLAAQLAQAGMVKELIECRQMLVADMKELQNHELA